MPPIGLSTSRTPHTKQTNIPKLWLILVGVNQYQDEHLPNLNYSAIDCQGLSEALTDATSQFPQKIVNIYHDFAPQSPSLANVRHRLQDITSTVSPIDTILFYFSGHGVVDPKTQEVFLCLADTQKSNLQNTGLALQEILQLLGNSGVQNQLVWLDACHSGGMSLRGVTLQLVELLQQSAAKSKGFYALLSCDNNQQSWEFPELGHGVFTYYLMRGLQGEAVDSQGLIYLDGLYRYVYHQTLQYIDKTNQQLRLINQQKRGKGDTQLYNEYPLQTPKRIVEGVGELILGKRLNKIVPGVHRGLGMVVEGLSNSKITLDISKFLGSTGDFAIEYLPATKTSAEDIKAAIARHWQQPQAELTLLYLRGRIEESEAGEWLRLGEDICIKRSWLKQQLRQCTSQQVIILDCPLGTASLGDWIEDLQIESHHGQCLIACASPPEAPENFAQKFLDTLMISAQGDGLSAAGAIAQLQLSLADSKTPLYVWLSGTQGIIEILTNNTHKSQQASGLDLGVCPYMGLNAFAEADAAYFYGRETVTQQLIHHLRDNSFLAVIGASGSGKSSVVQAGLIPQLRQGKHIPNSEQWGIKTIRPGVNPVETLARKLGEWGETHLVIEGILHQGVESFVYWLRSLPHRVTVLVIDQFEELFTLAPSPDRELFLELLLGAIQYAGDRFKLIITLRADFIAPCLEVPALAEALQVASVLVPPKLSLDDYRRVILHPAQQVGLQVEPELVEVLLRELNQSVGDLPLLEFVLEQLWQQRTSGKLTLQSYQEQLGGIKGALERSCQGVYESLPPQLQECAKWIFLSLTQLGEGTEDTRRRIYKSDLIVKKYPAGLVEQTLNVLTTAKLVVINLEADIEAQGKSSSSTPPTLPPLFVTVEVAHEILIRHWSTLRWWLEENRDRLRKQRQINHACQLWQQSGKQADFLLQGARLAEAEDIYIHWTDELGADVQEFIGACLAERKHQQLQAKNRLKQAQRAVVALSVLGIASISFGGLAYWQGREAQFREIAALNSSSQANLLSHQQLAALIASLKAAQQVNHAIAVPNNLKLATVTTLQQALFEMQERNRLEGHKDGVISISISRDGQIIASGGLDKTIKLWSRDGRLLRTLNGHEDAVYSVSFSPDGQTIASAGSDKTIKLWQTKDGTLLKTITGHEQTVNNVYFSPDGKTLASASSDHSIKLWDTTSGQLLMTLNGHSAGVISVRFSPDGQTIASGSEDKTVKLWHRQDGKLLKTLNGHQDWVNSLSFSPDGKTLASASADKTIKLWRIADGKLVKTLKGHNDSVWDVNFSPDGKAIASASRDNTIKLWNRHGIELETFTGHSGGVYAVNFLPDGKTLASASLDNTIRLWQRPLISPLEVLAGGSGVYAVSFLPDGSMIATAGADGKIQLWHSQDGSLLKTLLGNKAIYGISFTPQGDLIASANADKTVKIWRVRDGQLLKTLIGHDNEVNKVNFSPDGKVIASASRDNTVKLWNVSDGKLKQTLKGHTDEVFWVSFSPDGKIIASASADKTIRLWDSVSGNLIKTLPAHNDLVYSVNFSPDGSILASTSADKTVKLWRSHDGHLLHTFSGHSDVVYSSSFSPDSRYIASASEDKTVKIWQIDGHLLTTLPQHQAGVMSAIFSPDGKTLISGSLDTTTKIWRFDSQQAETSHMNTLIMSACNWLQDYLNTNPNVTPNEQKLCSN
ncbi:caspase family protein [Anabaena sp. CCY 9910]|uniref:nSTAND1 domain-containing NTPase n=1 Tax=Anabaena sp. CCY 9910 TaxID=3103870 RepID=UPI0039E08269